MSQGSNVNPLVMKRQQRVGDVPITADGREKRMAQRCKDGATGKVGMFPEPALHYHGIAFSRGVAPVSTLVPCYNHGATYTAPRLLEPCSGTRTSRRAKRKNRVLLQPGSPRELKYNRLHRLQAPSEHKIKKGSERLPLGPLSARSMKLVVRNRLIRKQNEKRRPTLLDTRPTIRSRALEKKMKRTKEKNADPKPIT